MRLVLFHAPHVEFLYFASHYMYTSYASPEPERPDSPDSIEWPASPDWYDSDHPQWLEYQHARPRDLDLPHLKYLICELDPFLQFDPSRERYDVGYIFAFNAPNVLELGANDYRLDLNRRDTFPELRRFTLCAELRGEDGLASSLFDRAPRIEEFAVHMGDWNPSFEFVIGRGLGTRPNAIRKIQIDLEDYPSVPQAEFRDCSFKGFEHLKELTISSCILSAW